MDTLLKRRFDEVLEQADKVEASKRQEQNTGFYGTSTSTYVDGGLLLTWTVNAENIILKACGAESPHLRHFTKALTLQSMETNHRSFQKRRAVLVAAKEDFNGGYLASVHNLVQAEVFGSELEQARELVKNKYAVAAAVIAGVVLETAIRNLCTTNNLPHGKLDKMNADLAKAGVYNGLMQKRIIHLAAIRNSAAHGNTQEFETYDVTAMIDEVERFLVQHLA
jgi:hypothetical protein